jgi:hypothetical protein
MKMGLWRAALLFAFLAACDSSDGPTHTTPDASPAIDMAVGPKDAPFSCMPVVPGPPAACLALAPSTLQGATPFGDLDVGLDYFGAGDCITISHATIEWTGACGEKLQLSFSYPVVDTGSGREVTGSFDTDARFEFRPPAMAPRDEVTTVHVDVVKWKEGQGVHDIDITVTVTDTRYALAPFHVMGTFCDWPYYLC